MLERRIDSFLICTQPGTYTLRTGAGPFDNDPECQSSHCQLRRQPVLATFVVVSFAASSTACLVIEAILKF